MQKLLLLLLLTTSLLNASSVYSKDLMEEIHTSNFQNWKYQVYVIRGWKVLIKDNVKIQVSIRMQKQLEYSLSLIDTRIPLNGLRFLKTIPIYITNESNYPLRRNEFGSLVFHHDRNWLTDHKLDPNMAVGIHIINPKEILDRHKTFTYAPFVLLHELSHGFHYYKLGADKKTVIRAYKNAQAAGLYSRVPSRNGDGRFVKAYALVSLEEYFAELTEAYFGENDYFPKNREELKKYDPIGYEAIKNAWQ
ncbi:MAG: hypothetical protein K9K67_07900 [Bacteriovoracaceae bacterium]|nr:hypothetical protein [Bacteriovoracaceae bacterium]